VKQSLLPSSSVFHDPIPEKKKIEHPPLKKRIIVIAGPTATGKTDISIALAQSIGGEIVSADSCQIYREMDIGTAKASPEQRTLIAHHLIDICDIKDPCNVAQFSEYASNSIQEILDRENVPIIVGGSGFYIHSLLYGPPLGPPSDKKVRQQLEHQMDNLGADALYAKLQALDPVYADTISNNDRHKIIRALEIMTLSERKVSDFPKPKYLSEQKYDFRCWFLYHPKETLYSRIEMRCDEMIKKGLLNEVRDLDAKGLRQNAAASQAIGYRQALAFLDSSQTESDLEKFVTQFKKATRHFSKRQFTWFRKEPLFRWLNVSEHPPERLKELILQDFEQGFPNV